MKIRRIIGTTLALVMLATSALQASANESQGDMRALYGVLAGYIERYGVVGVDALSGFESEFWPDDTGVQFAALIDFGNDGNVQLFVVYWPDINSDVTGRVYGLVNGQVVQHTSADMFLPGTDVQEFHIALANDGRTFFVISQGHPRWTLETSYYTIEDGEWIRVLNLMSERVGEDFVFDYFMDGAPVTEQLFRQAAATELGINEIFAAGLQLFDSPGSVGFVLDLLVDSIVAETETASDGIGILVDGAHVSMDVAPFIEGGRTFVPFRAIAEALGGTAAWDGEQQTATVTMPDGLIISMTIGGYNITATQVSGNVRIIANDAAPIIENGRTMLPVRGLAEAMGFDVHWDGENQNVVITKAEQ